MCLLKSVWNFIGVQCQLIEVQSSKFKSKYEVEIFDERRFVLETSSVYYVICEQRSCAFENSVLKRIFSLESR